MPDMVDRPDIVRDNPHVPHNHSTFNLKEVRLTTEHFGLVKPHMVIDDVSTDDFEYRPEYHTRSYTLRAPLMQDVHRKLSYVKVDLAAILPKNFEKFYANPVVGDDVPNDCGTVLTGGFKIINDAVKSALTSSYTQLTGANNFTVANLTLWLRALIVGEMFYSRGSLLSSLGCQMSSQLICYLGSGTGGDKSYDAFFDACIGALLTYLRTEGADYFTVRIGSTTYTVIINTSWRGSNSITFGAFLNEIRDDVDWEVLYLDSGSNTSYATSFVFTHSFTSYVASDLPFNFGRVCAYQLAIAEYMTNDKVDHIYSAELFRQYIGSLLSQAIGATYPFQFTANGMNYDYDFLSGKYLHEMLNDLFFYPLQALSNLNIYQYFLSMFGFRRSLRYKDYFVSSRVRPLAVGNVDVAVNANAVSVIDISRNIQVQRFLNAVNHSGRRLSNYIKTLFGINISADRHVPHWLADIDELVYTSEVENTGSDQLTKQQTVTAIFTGNSGNKQLHFYADLPGYIIGLTSYDIERAYPDSINRSFFIQDRFDMFIPEMQFIGDQPIYAQELKAGDVRSFGTAFGYQYRDMQYKLLHAVADGGFYESLPGYGYLYKGNYFQSQNISPDFIRSKVSELDEFYLQLSGWSLATYFHFISVITNNFYAKRPMIANPKILE